MCCVILDGSQGGVFTRSCCTGTLSRRGAVRCAPRGSMVRIHGISHYVGPRVRMPGLGGQRYSFIGLGAFLNHLIDQAIIARLFRGHPEIAVGILFHAFDRLFGMQRDNLVQARTGA